MIRKIILSIIILIASLIIGQTSYAAVEIVPSKSGDGKDAIVNINVSNSYLLCRGMKDTGGTLKGSGLNVEPHLATNKDWGAVSYLSNSIYGTNTQGGNNGISVTINDVNYYSTTTNITGVMNWGNNPNVTRGTQTSGLCKEYTSGNSNVTELYSNRETKYVDLLKNNSVENTEGMAIKETRNTYGFAVAHYSTEHPITIRTGLFSGYYNSYGFGQVGYNAASGNANDVITFRPVIWN